MVALTQREHLAGAMYGFPRQLMKAKHFRQISASMPINPCITVCHLSQWVPQAGFTLPGKRKEQKTPFCTTLHLMIMAKPSRRLRSLLMIAMHPAAIQASQYWLLF